MQRVPRPRTKCQRNATLSRPVQRTTISGRQNVSKIEPEQPLFLACRIKHKKSQVIFSAQKCCESETCCEASSPASSTGDREVGWTRRPTCTCLCRSCKPVSASRENQRSLKTYQLFPTMLMPFAAAIR